MVSPVVEIFVIDPADGGLRNVSNLSRPVIFYIPYNSSQTSLLTDLECRPEDQGSVLRGLELECRFWDRRINAWSNGTAAHTPQLDRMDMLLIADVCLLQRDVPPPTAPPSSVDVLRWSVAAFT